MQPTPPRRPRPSTLLAAVLCLPLVLASMAAVGGDTEPQRSGAQADAAATDLQGLRDRGKALYEEKDFAGAAEVFARVVQSPEATPQDWLNLALAHYENNDDAAALEAAGRALELSPDLTGAHYVRGIAHKRRGEHEAAAAALERARELDSRDPAIRFNLGSTYAQLGREEAAMAEFQAVIDMGFDVGLQHYVSALYRSSQLLLRQRRMDEARPLLELYEQHRDRLSQAARAAAALQRGRYTVVRVPNVNERPATPVSATRIAFTAGGMQEVSAGGWPAAGDLDGDGDVDLVITGSRGGVWLLEADGYRRLPLSTPAGPAGLGDFDRDGRPDLYVAHAEGDRLLRNVLGDAAGEGTEAAFEQVAAQGLPSGGAPTAVLWVDYDHDGDLDVLVTHGTDAEGRPVVDRLSRNLGGGAFESVGEAAGIAVPAPSSGALWADFDGDNDVDLYVLRPDGGNALYSNQRGGEFAEVADAVGAAGDGCTLDAVAEDFDNDGHLDLVLATASGLEALRNSGEGTFSAVDAGVAGGIGTVPGGLAVADWNNDGYLDLAVSTDDGPAFLVNAGGWEFEKFDPARPDFAAAGTALEAADVDVDGAVDLLALEPGRVSWMLQQGPVGAWIKVALQGVKNNLRGVGSTVEVKGTGFYQMRPLRDPPLHFGVAAAEVVHVVRITWPNGIVQNLLDEAPDRLLATQELERLEGSCPFLYTWDGEGWRFVNEVLGVAPLGMPLAEGVVHTPDADEYVPVPGEAMARRHGHYEIRFTEELREAGYLDAVRLLAVDHPEDVALVPDERFAPPPHPRFRLFWIEDPRPVQAVDAEGRDWSAELADVDHRWALPFEPDLYDGLATEHALTLTLPEARAGETVRLFLTGWVYWATGSINLAVDQDPRVQFTPVALEVPDGDGGWRVAIEDIGLPNGKNSTLAVDLTGVVDPDDPRVRLRTTMRLYWDSAYYTVGGSFPAGLEPVGDWAGPHGVPHPGELRLAPTGEALRVTVVSPARADLRFRGFSELHRTAEGFETFSYRKTSLTAPWNQHRGHYTRYGPVGALLDAADDRYVILGTGDEVAIRFPAELPPLPEGWRRDWLVYLNGWVKDGDPNTLHGDRVEPLPFHGMRGYPYRAGAFPDDPELQRFLETWVTREARRINPPLNEGR